MKREGSDVVVVTWGALVQRTILAAQQAEKGGISTMVMDLRTIIPYDWDVIADAVKKTNRIGIARRSTWAAQRLAFARSQARTFLRAASNSRS